MKNDGPQKGKKRQVIALKSRQHVYEDIDTERKERNMQELNAGRKGVGAGKNKNVDVDAYRSCTLPMRLCA